MDEIKYKKGEKEINKVSPLLDVLDDECIYDVNGNIVKIIIERTHLN